MSKAIAAANSSIEPHEPHWANRFAFQLVSLSLFAVQIALGFAIYHGVWWAAVPLIAVASHLMHGMLIGFHEASHGMLRSNRMINDIDGVLIGSLSFMSFTLYRASHQSHHMHLATEKDEELWPFVLPDCPRWARQLAAFVELTFGMFYTPFLFLRTFVRKDSPIRAKKVRAKIWREYALMVVVWASVITIMSVFGWWKFFFWIYFVPAFVAGNLQSVRKYIEHVGLNGNTPNSATRSIVSDSWVGRVVAFTLLHEPFHGIHHKHAGLPHPVLPQYVSVLNPQREDEMVPFPSYTSAFMHLFHSLKDPQVGGQWLVRREQAAAAASIPQVSVEAS